MTGLRPKRRRTLTCFIREKPLQQRDTVHPVFAANCGNHSFFRLNACQDFKQKRLRKAEIDKFFIVRRSGILFPVCRCICFDGRISDIVV